LPDSIQAAVVTHHLDTTTQQAARHIATHLSQTDHRHPHDIILFLYDFNVIV
jgi:hypothetical protein